MHQLNTERMNSLSPNKIDPDEAITYTPSCSRERFDVAHDDADILILTSHFRPNNRSTSPNASFTQVDHHGQIISITD